MRTTPRRAAIGAIGASVLLLTATACSSASDDSTGESLPGAAVETTADATGSTDSATPGADTASDTTAAPTPADTGGDDSSTTEAGVVVPEALQFTAPLVGGGTFDGAAVAGKPTVFWFWAPT